MPWATITQTLPRILHSMQTDCELIAGRRPAEQAVITSRTWRLVRRAALELEVDRHVGADRRRGARGSRCTPGSRRRRRRSPRRRRSSAAPGCRPAFAQAPIVTSLPRDPPDLADPLHLLGRRDRALDDRDVVGALDRRRASPRGSARSRSRPGAASSSSSRLRIESWQPSQEVNFQTASFGLALRRAIRAPGSRTTRSASRPAEHGPVAADERRPPLAVAAVADRAAHVALHRERRSARPAARARAAPRRRSASSPPVRRPSRSPRRGSSSARSISAGTTPTRPRQSRSAASTITPTLDVARAPPSSASSSRVEQLSRGRGRRRGPCTRPKRSRRASARRAPERSGARPTPPATMTRSPPSASAIGQPRPKGPRTPSSIALGRGADGRGDGADGPHRVHEPLGRPGRR